MLSSNVPILEVVERQAAFDELITMLTAVNDEMVLPHVEKLLEIRRLRDQTDIVTIEASLRGIGINLATGLMRKQARRLAKGFDFLNTYHEVVDTGFWADYAQFLINNIFRVKSLWSADYETFYREPQGETIINGGRWYPTTHVELEVGIGAQYAGFDLKIDHDMVPEIADLLVKNFKWSKDVATVWAERHVGLQLNNKEDPVAFVRMYVFSRRVAEFFYQWAPIDDVLESIVFVNEAGTDPNPDGGGNGTNDPKDPVDPNKPPVDPNDPNNPDPNPDPNDPDNPNGGNPTDPDDPDIPDGTDDPDKRPSGSKPLRVGMAFANEEIFWSHVGGRTLDLVRSGFVLSGSVLAAGELLRFSYRSAFVGGGEVTYTAVCRSPRIEAGGINWCTFVPPSSGRETLEVELWCPETGATGKVNLTLSSPSNVVDPDEIAIRPKNNPVTGGSRVPFRCVGKFQGHTYPVDITDSGLLTWETELGVFDGSTLVIPNTVEDMQFMVRCIYTGSHYQREAQFKMTARKSILKRVPTALRIECPQELAQGTNVQIKAFAKYNDGIEVEVLPVWSISSRRVSIEGTTLSSATYIKDYRVSLYATFADASDPVHSELTISLLAKRWRVNDTRVRLPVRAVEGSDISPQAQAFLVAEGATQEQIDSGDSRYVLGWRAVHEAFWYGVHVDGAVAARPNPVTGEFQVPTVTKDTEVYIGFNGKYDGQSITGTGRMTAYDRVMTVTHIDVVCVQILTAKSTTRINTFGNWNNGGRTEIGAELQVEFEPSQSSYRRVYEETKAEIERLEAAGEPFDHLSLTDLDYAKYIALEFRDSLETFVDVATGLTHVRQLLYFNGSLHGQALLTATYTHNGTTTVDRRRISLSPTRARVTGMRMEIPEVIGERTRTFVRALVDYADGTSEYVDSVWSAELEDDGGFTPLVIFSSREWEAPDLIYTLEGKVPETFEEFMRMPTSRLPIFAGMTTLEEIKKSSFVGAVVQVDQTEEVVRATISSRFFNENRTSVLTILPATPLPINDIVEARIEGPIEVKADNLYASYALVCTYRLTGSSVLADGTEVEQGPYDYDLEVSNDWFLSDPEELVNGQYVPATSALAAIDGDGYMRPLRNVDGRVTLRAVFDDNYNKFSRTIVVYIQRVNTYLMQLDILGQTNVSDDPALNPTIEYSDGIWYVPYRLRLFTADNSEGFEVSADDALWAFQAPTGLTGVSVGDQTGRLYVSQQNSDAQLTLTATLRYPDSKGVMETITGAITLNIQSSRAITEATIKLPPDNIVPDENIQLVMEWKRRNGVTGDSLHPIQTVSYEWLLLEGASRGVTLSSTGVIRFKPSAEEQTATVQCTLKEDRTVIVESVIVLCPGVGYPVGLTVTGHARVRDDSIIKFRADVSRAQRPTTEETSNCFWSLRNANGDSILYPGIEIDPRTGVMTIALLPQDQTVYIHCLFVEGGHRFEKTHVLQVVSSIPYYGEGPFGINQLDELLKYIKGRLNSGEGGMFYLDARDDQFGYFACRADFGTADIRVVALPNGAVNTMYEGWDGASWTLTDFSGTGPIFVNKEYDNLVDKIAIYRTNKRAGLLGRFSVRYLKS